MTFSIFCSLIINAVPEKERDNQKQKLVEGTADITKVIPFNGRENHLHVSYRVKIRAYVLYQRPFVLVQG